MAKADIASARAPRGTKAVSQAFFAALDAVPEARRAEIAKAAQIAIRDELKLRRDRARAQATAAREKARKPAARTAKPAAKVAAAKPAAAKPAAAKSAAKPAAAKTPAAKLPAAKPVAPKRTMRPRRQPAPKPVTESEPT